MLKRTTLAKEFGLYSCKVKVASEFDEPHYFQEMHTGLHTLQVCNSLSCAHYADNTRKRTTTYTDETMFRVFLAF